MQLEFTLNFWSGDTSYVFPALLEVNLGQFAFSVYVQLSGGLLSWGKLTMQQCGSLVVFLPVNGAWCFCRCLSRFQPSMSIGLLRWHLLSLSVVSDSLWPHGLQHTRLPCPSPSSRICSKSCPLSRWCHPTISSSVTPFSFCLQSVPASGSFPISQLFTSGGQNIGASASVFPINPRGWVPLGFKESTARAGDRRDSDSTAGWKDHPEESVASTSVFCPGESHGQRSLVGYSL